MTGSTVRPRPCPTCPYRRDVPSGVWSAAEYRKLPEYDGEVYEQATAGRVQAFNCHGSTEQVCAGWAGHRDPTELLAVRLGVSAGALDASVADYSTTVPLFESGQAACDHGMRDVENPGPEARAAIRKLRQVLNRHR